MKIISFLSTIIFSLSLLASPLSCLANAAPSSSSLTQKSDKQQVRQQKKQEKLANRVSKSKRRINKRTENIEMKSAFDREKWIYSLLFLGVALVLTAFAVIGTLSTTFVAILIGVIFGYLAGLAFALSIAFLAWWIGEELDLV